MLKYLIALILLLGLASCELASKNNTRESCPYPFVSSYNGYSFNYCYYYGGTTSSFTKAYQQCISQFNFGLVTPKFSAGLDDLYKLYKAYPNFYFWVGAIATPANPKQFKWQDGSLVPSTSWCSGHPKGGDNLCAFYTTTAVIGRDKCISSGPCVASVFDHNIICQYGVY